MLCDRQRLAALQQGGWRRVGMGRRGAVEAARVKLTSAPSTLR